MKPQSLNTRDRIIANQEAALEAIRLSHEKEAWEPIRPFEVPLPVDDILQASYPAYAVDMGEELPFWWKVLRAIWRWN